MDTKDLLKPLLNMMLHPASIISAISRILKLLLTILVDYYDSHLMLLFDIIMAFIQVSQILFESDVCGVNCGIFTIKLLPIWSSYLASGSLMTK